MNPSAILIVFQPGEPDHQADERRGGPDDYDGYEPVEHGISPCRQLGGEARKDWEAETLPCRSRLKRWRLYGAKIAYLN
jgi:hypothetical protein